MGTDIYGYIEINTIEESGEDVWHEMIDISLIAERNYDIFGKLFGVRATEEINILAKSRGIPLDTANRKSLMEYEESLVYHSWAIAFPDCMKYKINQKKLKCTTP